MTPVYQYVWLLWASAFLVPWALLYYLRPALRQHMVRVSAATSLLGPAEPIFVPEYWNPPTLFDFAQRTGCDIESFIFSFSIGGIGSARYNALAGRELHPVPAAERYATRHRLHALALMTPYLSFPLLYALPGNVIYAGITALAIGATLTVLCRPELRRKTLLGGSLFLALYAAFIAVLVAFAPGYMDRVWNLADLSGVLIAGIPLEELAFGFAFGTYWAGLYEHFSWRTTGARATSPFASSRGRHV